MTRSTPHVLSTRVGAHELNEIRKLAADHRCSVSELTRRALSVIKAGATTDPGAVLADLVHALGLPDDAPPDAILSAIERLISTVNEAPEPDPAPLQDAPDPPPPPRALSARAQAYCREHGLTPDEFRLLCASRVRRAGAAPAPRPAVRVLSAAARAYIKKHGISRAEFEAIKDAKLVRRYVRRAP